MKLWLIEADTHGYDVYKRAVVAAKTKEEAAATHPGGAMRPLSWFDDHWVNDPKDVQVTYLGEAKRGTKRGVILSDFLRG